MSVFSYKASETQTLNPDFSKLSGLNTTKKLTKVRQRRAVDSGDNQAFRFQLSMQFGFLLCRGPKRSGNHLVRRTF